MLRTWNFRFLVILQAVHRAATDSEVDLLLRPIDEFVDDPRRRLLCLSWHDFLSFPGCCAFNSVRTRASPLSLCMRFIDNLWTARVHRFPNTTINSNFSRLQGFGAMVLNKGDVWPFTPAEFFLLQADQVSVAAVRQLRKYLMYSLFCLLLSWLERSATGTNGCAP